MNGARRPAFPLALTLLAVVAFALASACGERSPAPASPEATAPSRGEQATPEAAPSPTPTAVVARPSAGCSAPDAALYAAAGAVQPLQLEVGEAGTTRTYRLYLPAGLTPARPAPLVLNFHGLGSSGMEQEQYSRLLPVADREGFVVVSPDGLGQPRRWQIPGLTEAARGEGPDFAFFDLLLETLGRSLCLDLARVYSTGMSNGAFFSSVLACYRPEAVAAVAPVAGVFFPPEGCRGQVPLLAIHGREDAVVPYEEGLIFGVVRYAGAEAYVADWARQNGCGPERERTRLAPHVEEGRYPACAADTVLVTVEDGGHTWPGSAPVPRLGNTNQEVSAAELIWEFFAQHPKR